MKDSIVADEPHHPCVTRLACWSYHRWAAAPGDTDGRTDSSDEFALTFDHGRSVRLLVVPALFDEANKMRRHTVELMRRLSLSGIDSVLPDLPGCNESQAPLDEQTLAGWRAATRRAADHFGATHILTLRLSALLAPEYLPGWRQAPIGGNQILRAMMRARLITAKEDGIEESRESLLETGRENGLVLAGWPLGPEMINELEAGELHRIDMLTDIAQGHLGGGGLWLRAEPDEDPEQTDALAAIIAVALEDHVRPPSYSITPYYAAQREAEKFTAPLRSCSEPIGARRLLTFSCERDQLGASLDMGEKTTGLLYVSGGNEIRVGAFNGQALMASKIAAAGYPVFRYDRRGIGDSDGENAGFRESAEDIAAALAAFRAAVPGLKRVYGFGNCDAASALMLMGGAGLDGLILSNPWVFDEGSDDEQMAPSAVRARYLSKLADPSEVKRLLSGGVNLKKLFKGLGQAAKSSPQPSSLAEDMAAGLEDYSGSVDILLANADRTAQMFDSVWADEEAPIRRCEGASHAYVEPESFGWLEAQILDILDADE